MTRNGSQTTGFALNSQIAADSIAVTDLRLSVVRLMNDARFPWVLLVPRIAGVEEISDLSQADRSLLMEESVTVSNALQSITNPTKMNIAAIGNMVRQLHVHVVARFEADEAWPGPIWGVGERRPYDDDGTAMAALLRAELAAQR